MVLLSEVPRGATVEDETSSGFVTEDEDAYSVSDPGDYALEDDFDPSKETMADRIFALREMLSPSARSALTSSLAVGYTGVWKAAKLAGNGVWILSTAALLVGLPYAVSLDGEAMVVQQEKEYLAQQQGAQAMMGGPQANPFSVPGSLTPQQ